MEVRQRCLTSWRWTKLPSDQFRYLNDHELESYINDIY